MFHVTAGPKASVIGASSRLGPGTGALGDAFFALSGFHALHVLGGLVAIALLLRGRASAETRLRRLRLATVYMDFVAVCLV